MKDDIWGQVFCFFFWVSMVGVFQRCTHQTSYNPSYNSQEYLPGEYSETSSDWAREKQELERPAQVP